MGGGKSGRLIQQVHAHQQRSLTTEVFVPSMILSASSGPDAVVKSRIGITCRGIPFDQETDLRAHLHGLSALPQTIFVDEAQFLTSAQVGQLGTYADEVRTNVECYGLRTDSNGTLFEGSQALFEVADEFEEITSICYCGKRATMTLRYDKSSGAVIREGDQICIGGDDMYVAVCRFHWSKGEYN